MNTQQEARSTTAAPRPKRRLKPGVAAQLAARAAHKELKQLYSKPVQELTPEEIRQMKAAFFQKA
jgi:hypothetical protein